MYSRKGHDNKDSQGNRGGNQGFRGNSQGARNSGNHGGGRHKEDGTIVTPPDKTLIAVAIFLVVIGIMAVFSSSAPRAIASGDSPLIFTIKQIAWMIGGIFGCWWFSKTNYNQFKKLSLMFGWIVVGLLLLVQFTPLGVTVNEAKRWLMIGPLQFQPSEICKPAAILMFATIFSKNIKLFDQAKIPHYIVFGLMLLLTYKQPNLSMVVLLITTFLAIYFCAGGNIKNFFLYGAAAVPVLWFTIKDYQKQRLLIWLDPEKDPLGAGYNIIQSLVAFADGSFFGVGYGNSKQKLSWLPEGHTDFIFAVIAEEFGFLGCFFLICLFAVFVYRGFLIASRSTDLFGKLLAVGITFSIGFQALINMSVTSALVPATGIPLPFISYGGSSLFVTLCMLGVLLSISRKRVQKISARIKSYE